MIHTTHYDSPIGRFLLAARGNALTGLWIEGQKYFPDSFKEEEMTEREGCQVLKDTKTWLDRYFAGEKPSIHANGLDHMSAQAVGGAVGHNPISVIIPCHRVVGTDGSLTGYAGGIDRKIKLLTLEGVDMGRLFVPGEKAAAIYRVS